MLDHLKVSRIEGWRDSTTAEKHVLEGEFVWIIYLALVISVNNSITLVSQQRIESLDFFPVIISSLMTSKLSMRLTIPIVGSSHNCKDLTQTSI